MNRRSKSSRFCRNTPGEDLADVRVIFGDEFLLHSLQLRLHLCFAHGGNRKGLSLVQKVLDQVFPHLEDKQDIRLTISSKTIQVKAGVTGKQRHMMSSRRAICSRL